MTYPSSFAVASSSSSSAPAQDAGILYQIDCCKASSGKTVSMTKRRVRWRFGFANRMAMEKGSTGVDCRGYEHEVTFVWSVASGKKLIVHDQQEVHYSQGRREGKFTFMWNAGGLMFTLIAYAAPPVSKNHRAYGKQFELLINNVPFDALPRIYQLGKGLLKEGPMSAGRLVSHGVGTVRTNYAPQQDVHAYHYNRRSVQDEMAWAKNMHAIEAKRNMNDYVRSDSPASVGGKSNYAATSVKPEEPLLDLISAPIQGSNQDLLSDPSPLSSAPSTFSFDGMYVQNHDEFSPNQTPSYQAIWSSIMDAYDTGVSSQVNSTVMPVVMTSVQHVESSMYGLYVDTSLAPKSSTSLKLDSPTDITALDGAFQNLVNLDDISQPVLQSYTASSQKNKWEGKENVPLKDLKKSTDAPNREIMRTYAVHQHQNPGALVVYGHGQSQYAQQGPPPLSFGYTY